MAAIESVTRLFADALTCDHRLLCRGMGGGVLRYLESINIALHYPRLDNVKKHMWCFVIYRFTASFAEVSLSSTLRGEATVRSLHSHCSSANAMFQLCSLTARTFLKAFKV